MIGKFGKTHGSVGSANPDGLLHIDKTVTGSPGDDHLRGSNSSDFIDASQGGDDIVRARSGDDEIYFGAAFTGADRVIGNAGQDTVKLDGDYSSGIDILADSFSKIESLVVVGGTYVIRGDLNYRDEFGDTFIDASGLGVGQSLNLDVQTSGALLAVGGSGDDVINASANGNSSFLVGNAGNDTLIGGSGTSRMIGGAGADTLIMGESTDVATYSESDVGVPKVFDTIENFSSNSQIQLNFDSDENTEGFQFNFHLGKTSGHVGDILSHYDHDTGQTIIKVYTNDDDKADFILHLSGEVHLTRGDFIFGRG